MGILTRFCIFKLKWSWAKRGELDIFMLFCSLFCHLNLFIYRWKVHKQFTTRFYAKNLQDWRMKFEKKFRICQNSTWARLMQNSHSSDWRAEKESLRTLTGSRRPALAEFLFFFSCSFLDFREPVRWYLYLHCTAKESDKLSFALLLLFDGDRDSVLGPLFVRRPNIFEIAFDPRPHSGRDWIFKMAGEKIQVNRYHLSK